LRSQKLHFEKEFDYNQFQYNELHEASFSENELEELDARLKMQGNTEGVKTALTRVYHDLEESEKPMVQQLKMLQNLLSPFSQYHPGLASLLSRLQSMQIELQDIADEISMLNNQVQYDPVKIEAMQERLSTGYKLLKKHGLKTTADLLEKQQSLEEKLQAVLDIDMVIAEKEKETSRLFEEASSLAKNISTERKKQVKPFQDKVNSLLSQVGMPNAKIKVEVTEVPLHQYGGDEIEFCFDANRSNQFQPIRKVASGGELSRLMLCIKSLVAQSMDLPTLIFDEIDSGISGEAARQVGMIMKELAARRQVICITHQPQIAGRGDRHFFVFKQVVHDAVKTGIKVLSKEERITAIAKMLGGEKPTAAAMENAREMVEH
jgi:DNA repair protein RecN (Recombination protein N)